ncbi:hypothetical protein JOC95_000287 [Bacillus tianshenii]|uniref:Methyl-accepting chemotaxis protein n=1 Tax=Sutcliffiella tianshenii TaxID=1463404 RepID=A0ABS2NUW0_9BACI|nr:hypothetical protein [Bacillus tianshenii]MBM7618445.1 hypothetical protein [Bacillus tianshenii]MCA1320430.1 hypothetical protein [Bacillus tianshenii]
MDPKVKSKISSIIQEISVITRELEDISNGINHEFKGIGSNYSSASLRETAQNYRNISNELRKI